MTDIDAIRKRLSKKREDGVFTDWTLADTQKAWIGEMWADIDALLAEVERNTCVCGHAFADHELHNGTNYITCRVCENECERDDTWSTAEEAGP